MTMHMGRHIVYWLLVLSGLPWLAARLNRRKVLVLVYHGVHAGRAEPVLNFDGMHVRARRFVRQMRYVSRRYRVVTLAHLTHEPPRPHVHPVEVQHRLGAPGVDAVVDEDEDLAPIQTGGQPGESAEHEEPVDDVPAHMHGHERALLTEGGDRDEPVGEGVADDATTHPSDDATETKRPAGELP